MLSVLSNTALVQRKTDILTVCSLRGVDGESLSLNCSGFLASSASMLSLVSYHSLVRIHSSEIRRKDADINSPACRREARDMYS